MEILTRLEELILTSVWRLKENAYGVAVRNHLKDIAGMEMIYGTLYNCLDQLVKKGLIQKAKGEPLPERGGRARIYFTLTEKGTFALQDARDLQDTIWEGIPVFTRERKSG